MRLIWKTIPMMRGKQESSYHPENTQGVWILDFLGNLSGMALSISCVFWTPDSSDARSL